MNKNTASALERALERYPTHPLLEPIYNPTLLARAPAISADISYFLEDDNWKDHPLHQKLLASSTVQLNAYVSRITSLADQEDQSGLLAHSYVRYMGDLSGGQNIRHVLAKAYDLDETADFGISFYVFKELKSANRATMGEMKRIKEWFRSGMNTVGENCDPKLKGILPALFFALIFMELHQPLWSTKLSSPSGSALVYLTFSMKPPLKQRTR